MGGWVAYYYALMFTAAETAEMASVKMSSVHGRNDLTNVREACSFNARWSQKPP